MDSNGSNGVILSGQSDSYLFFYPPGGYFEWNNFTVRSNWFFPTSSGYYISLNNWVLVSDGIDCNLYINGTALATQPASRPYFIFPFLSIGNHPNSGVSFIGKTDEVRYNSTKLSADWIKTEYNTQNSPDTFYSMGLEI
jgi:hypothetical protein